MVAQDAVASQDLEIQTRDHILCRAGIFMLRLPQAPPGLSLHDLPIEIRKKIFEGIAENLESDPRVVSASISADRPKSSPRVSVHYPLEADQDGKEILFGADAFCVLTNDELLTFSVKVPKKNQPRKNGHDDVPTETYWAGWDGVTLVVTWTQPSSRVPFSGGHVVVDVLADAVKASGGILYNQACAAGCENQFMHTVLHVVPLKDKSQTSGPRRPIPSILPMPGDYAEAYVELPLPMNPEKLIKVLWLNLCMSMGEFAELKNLSKRIVDMEGAVRRRLSEVLEHYYNYFEVSEHKFFRRVQLRWQRRKWKKQVRQLLAGIWLALSNLELLQRRWQETLRDFEDITNERDHACLFAIDYGDDAAHVQALELEHLEANASQISQRLDSGQVVFATLMGAMAGGLAGGILGATATLIAAP